MAIRKITPRSILSGALTENLNIDSGTLYVDTSANRVGIVTTSPTTALSVVGSANITSTSSNSFKVRNTVAGTSAYSQISIGNDTDADLLYMQAFSTTYTTAGVAIQNGAVINGEGVGGLNLAATQAPIRFFSGGDTERMRLDSNGHLGLGVTPSATWSLGGGKALQLPSGSLLSYSTTDLHIAQNSFYNGSNWVYTNTGTATLNSQLSGEFQWSSVASGSAGSTASFTRRMTLSAAGKLGLGNSNPSQLLHLEVSSGDIYQQIQSGANLVYVGYEASRDVGVIQSNNALTFDMGNSYVERMRLDTSGNLGLAVTPSAWQTTSGSRAIQFTGSAVYGYRDTNLVLTQNAYFDGAWKYYASSIATAYYSIGSGVHSWFNAPSGTATNPITFTQAMTLNADGTLGIGSTGAGNKLTVSNAGANGFEVDPLSASGTKTKLLSINRSGSAYTPFQYDASLHEFQTSGGEKMRITAAGNVGIGTTSPAALLEVYGGDIRLRSTSNGANGFLTFVNTSNVVASSIYNYNGLLSLNEQLIINNSTGNVGIGTTTPAFKTEIVGGATTVETTLFQIRSDAGGIGTGSTIAFANSTTASAGSGRVELAAIRTTSSGGSLVIRTGDDSGTIQERMRINSTGNILIGTTSSIGNGGVLQAKGPAAVFYLETNSSSGSQNVIDITNASNTAYKPMRFWVNGYPATEVGSITCTTSVTSYNTSSDYRLKENIAPMTGALAKVAQLNPVTYRWKTDGSDGQGFIAHELQAVVPDCVTGEKDAIDENGKPQYQAMDTSHLVATLTKAIQEQQALIESLTARLTAVENK